MSYDSNSLPTGGNDANELRNLARDEEQTTTLSPRGIQAIADLGGRATTRIMSGGFADSSEPPEVVADITDEEIDGYGL